MGLPEHNANGWLPEGVHLCTWGEFKARFGSNGHRRKQLVGLRRAIKILLSVGVATIYVDGSFVSTKEYPADYDACWATDGVDLARLQGVEPAFFRFENRRAAQKAAFFGEFLPSGGIELGSLKPFVEFFQIDKDTGKRKGIVLLDLRDFE
jgi:hypothetical protein